MPIVEVNGQEIEFPDSMSQAEIKSVLDRKFGPQTKEEPLDPSLIDTSIGLGGETAAGFNRAILQAIEFVPVTAFNAISELVGSDVRIPEEFTPSKALVPEKGAIGGEGLASEIAGTAGEFAGTGLTVGSALRGIASKLPQFTQGESALTGFIRQLGQGTGRADIAAGVSSGAGAEVGEEIGGETGRMVGSIAAPLAAAPIAAAASRIAQPRQTSAVLEAGKQFDVPVMTSDVAPPKNIVTGLARQLGERIPLFGTGGARAVQQEARERAVREFTNKMPVATSDDIVNSLKSKTSAIKRAAGNRLESVKKELTGLGDVPRTNLVNQVDDAITRLKSVKIEPDTATIKKLESIRDGAAQSHTFAELRDARTAVREIADAVDPVGRSQLPSKSKAALKAVEKSITRDLDEFAKKNLGENGFTRYKKADAVWAEEATKLTKTKLKNILDKGDLTPETVETMLFSRKPSEVTMLYNSLGAEGRQAARSSLVQRALQKATKGEEISPTSFAKELDRLRDNVGVFFKGDDLKAINGLKNLLLATQRAQEAGAVTPTGQSLFFLAGIGGGSQVGFIPTLAAAASGGAAARIYESKPVRDMLLKMADTSVSPEAYGKIAASFTPSIRALIEEQEQE